jgi:8-oxo-dGTP pyrophosphatase MutT (NUDIX family)
MPRREVVAVEISGDLGPGEGGFLTLVRLRCCNRYADGSRSRGYSYEYIHRRGYDAVAIALYCETPGGPLMAYRGGIRVPVYFRRTLPLTVPDDRAYDLIPEAVAGSLEPADEGVSGFLARVVAEVWEEAGFRITPGLVEPLGGGFFPSHGQSSEKIHLCAVRVDPEGAQEPEGDGSVNEADAPPIGFRPVREILLDCAGGVIEDPKIEILARRLCLRLGYLPEVGRYAEGPERESVLPFRHLLDEAGWAAHREKP